MLNRILASACLVLVSAAGAAVAGGPQFSADAVQSQPGREMRSGRLYVGALGTRFEYQQHGRPVVQIMLAEKGIMRMLFPLDRIYMEFKGRPGAAMPLTRPIAPCTAGPQLDCKQDAEADMAGIKSQRWRIVPKGAPGPILVWWDKQRKMALREEYFDGRVMQAIMRGTQTYENRKVESWEFTYLSPNGRYRRATSLIDPDLGIAVVERQSGGALRQLRNITPGAPDAKLFDVPKGYKLVKAPQPPRPMPPKMRGGKHPQGAGPRGMHKGQGWQGAAPRGSHDGSMGAPYVQGPGTQMGQPGQMGRMMPAPYGRALPNQQSGGGGNPK